MSRELGEWTGNSHWLDQIYRIPGMIYMVGGNMHKSKLATELLFIAVLAALALSVYGCGAEQPVEPQVDDPVSTFSTSLRAQPPSTKPLDSADLQQVRTQLASLERPTAIDESSWQELRQSFVDAITAKTVSDFMRSAASTTSVADLRLESSSSGESYLLWTYSNRGDYDQNGETNGADLAVLGKYWQQTLSSQQWKLAQVADGDKNGVVNLGDLTTIAVNYQHTVNHYKIEYSLNGTDWWTAGFAYLQDARDYAGDGILRFTVDLATTDPDPYYRVTPYINSEAGTPSQVADLAAPLALANPYLATIDGAVQLEHSVSMVGQKALRTTTQPGDLMPGYTVFNEGDQRLYVVDAIEGNTLLVHDGNLADAWTYLDCDFSQQAANVEVTFIPAPGTEGGEIQPKGTSDFTLGESWELEISKMLKPGLKVMGTIAGRAELEAGINLGQFWQTGKVDHFHLGEKLELELKAEIECELLSATITGQHHFGDVLYRVFYATTPIPVVYLLRIPIFYEVTGNVSGGVRFGPELRFTQNVKLDYTPSTNWTWSASKGFDTSFGFDHEYYIQGQIESALKSRIEVLLYGVAGPYCEIRAPISRIKLEKTTDSDEFKVSVGVGASATVGLMTSVDKLGLPKLAPSEVISSYRDVYVKFWRQGGGGGSGSVVPAPTNFAVSTGHNVYPGGINLYWVPAPGYSTYRIRRECITGNDPNGSVSFTDSNGVGHVDYSVKPGPQYRYRYRISTLSGAQESVQVISNDGWAYLQFVPDPPVPSVAANPSIGVPPLHVNFNGGNSYDPDGGSITTYEWDWSGDGSYDMNSGSDPTVEYNYESPGSYHAKLRVTDNEGATATTSVAITVTQSLTPPQASMSASPASGSAPLNVSFDGGGSYDPDGGVIVQYEWDWTGDGIYDQNSGSDPTVAYSYVNAGSYSARLRVTDNEGDKNTAQRTIVVGESAQPPVAILNASPSNGNSPLSVSFDSSGSFDPDGGSIVKYEWDWTSNGSYDYDSGIDPTVDYTYIATGSMTCRVRVTDNEGVTSTATAVVNVGQVLTPPMPNCSAIPFSGPAPLNVSFDGSGSYDPDGGSIVKFEWDWTNNGSYDLDSGVDSTVAFSYASAGSHAAKLRVTDNEGATATLVISINVSQGLVPPVAILSAIPTSGAAPLNVNFDGSGSNDPDGGQIVKYEWDWTANGSYDLNSGVDPTVSHSYSQGSHIAKLRVTDDEGSMATTTIGLNVSAAANNPPSINIQNPRPGATVSRDCKPTAIVQDSDGNVVSVKFFIDNVLKDIQYTGAYFSGDLNNPAVSHGTFHPMWFMWGSTPPNYATWELTGVSNGSHIVKVVATDDDGDSSEQSITVNVNNSGTPSGTYLANKTAQTNHDVWIARGSSYTITLTYKNLGTATWYNYGPHPVRLAATRHNGGVNQPSDANSLFWGFDWIKHNRIGVMGGDIGQLSCGPGQSVTFNVPIHVPLWCPVGENYYLNWNLVAENHTWIKDQGGVDFGNHFVRVRVF